MLPMIARLLALGAAVLVLLSLAQGWAPTRWMRTFWERHGGYLRWYVASAPGTCIYVGILAVTTWVLLGMPEYAKELFLAAQSTNLEHLTRDPLRVLVRSAFFVSGAELLLWGALFLVFLAPAERWLGTGRAVVVFATGHIVATLLTAWGVYVRIRWFHGPESLWNVQDTGASYGFMALAGIMVYRLRGWNRAALLTVLLGVVVYGFLPGTGFTATGHSFAVMVGLSLYPLTRRPEVRTRVHDGEDFADLCRRSTADGRTFVLEPYPRR